MKKLITKTAIILMATSGFAFAQGTSGVTPEEELRMELQDNITTGGVNRDGIEDFENRPSRELKDQLSDNVRLGRGVLMNNDCVERSELDPNIELSRDLAGTEKDLTNPC